MRRIDTIKHHTWPRSQWESNNFTIRHHKRESNKKVSPFPGHHLVYDLSHHVFEEENVAINQYSVLSEPEFYGDLVYKLKKIVGSNNFSAQFIKIISNYKKIGYNINVLQQTACLVVNPITVGNFAFLFNCTPVGRTSDSMMVPT